jgi:hypothetical protein
MRELAAAVLVLVGSLSSLGRAQESVPALVQRALRLVEQQKLTEALEGDAPAPRALSETRVRRLFPTVLAHA